MIFFIVCKGVFYVAMRNRFIFTIARFFKCCGNHWNYYNVVFTRFCGILRGNRSNSVIARIALRFVAIYFEV